MTQTELKNFSTLGIIEPVVKVLTNRNISTPTPIQNQAIPSAIEGKDIVGIAQTGTGKTYAFGLPMIQQLLAKPTSYGLIMVPTRELAQQVVDSLRPVTLALNISLTMIIGGAPMDRQIGDLKRRPRIIVSTPGRLIDHMKRRTVMLDKMDIVVLDEADRMLDMGFAPQINEVMTKVAPKRQTMLFSATMPHEIMTMATKYMTLPIRIEVAPAGTTALLIEQEVFIVDKMAKPTVLEKLLIEHKGKVLIFTRTKHGAKNLCHHLRGMGHQVGELHSNKSLGQRRTALADFKSEKSRILVATDIAARGIDVKEIELVVNYDLPENSEDYVHRIGRTGRAGSAGKAVSFADPSQRSKLLQIERLIRKTLKTTKLSNIPGQKIASMPRGDSGFRPSRSGSPRSSSGGYSSGRSFDKPRSSSSTARPYSPRPATGGRPQSSSSRPYSASSENRSSSSTPRTYSPAKPQSGSSSASRPAWAQIKSGPSKNRNSRPPSRRRP